MNDLLTTAVNALQAHWAQWLGTSVAWLAGGGAVWLVTQAAKGAKAWEKASVIQRFVYAVSLLGTGADWYVRNYSSHFAHAQNPGWIPVMAAGLFTIATFIHHTPLKKLIGSLNSTVQPYFAAVKELKAAKAAQPTPAQQDSFQ